MISGWIDTLLGAATMLCFFCAILQYKQGRQVRSRRMLGWIMLIWGMVYLLYGVLFDASTPFMQVSGFLRPPSLVGPALGVYMILLYFIELVRPGWITFRRTLLLFTPFLLPLAIYFSILAVRGEPVELLDDFDHFKALFSQFNVWFRIVLVTISFGFMVGIVIGFWRFIPQYRQWVDDHYSTTERMDIRWLRYYLLGLIALLCNYAWLLTTGGMGSFVANLLINIFFWGYVNYKAIFHENPYPEGFFYHTLNDSEAEQEAFPEQEEASMAAEAPGWLEEQMMVFDTWMRTEKPYLNPVFQRMDVTQKMQINRTYLSRLFSEGFGANFNQLVRNYRIEEACRLLREQPQLTARQISARSGFASEAVFFRAFQQVQNMTPGKYRENL